MPSNNIYNHYNCILGGYKPVILDIGARNGTKHKILNELADKSLIKLILIELDKKEARKLNSKNIIVIDKAIWDKKGTHNVYLTKNKSYTSLLKPNENVIRGSFYYDRNFYKIVGKSKTKTTTINEILSNKKNNIRNIDFLKIDIQGGESKIFENLTKNNWNNLLGCETEAYSSQVYENCKTIEYYFNKFYKNNFELYKMINISSLIRTSYLKDKIFNNKYLGARPNTKFYRGKQLTFDLLFFKNINQFNKRTKIKKLRIFIFLFVLNGYFDHALYTILDFKKKKLISTEIFLDLKVSIKEIFNFNLNPLRRIKERILLKNYFMNK